MLGSIICKKLQNKAPTVEDDKCTFSWKSQWLLSDDSNREVNPGGLKPQFGTRDSTVLILARREPFLE
jgi:hypothetical protein